MKPHVLLLDNYDSFTFNLVQILRESGLCTFEVAYNDAIDSEDCRWFDKIILSPGPGLPYEAGIIKQVIERWAPEKSILGVCLGHQAIGVVFGANLKRLSFPKHGTREQVFVCDPDAYLFKSLPDQFPAGHYHSWVLDHTNIPSMVKITATDLEGNIMAIRHCQYDVQGVQFHPESIMTPNGRTLVHNFLAR